MVIIAAPMMAGAHIPVARTMSLKARADAAAPAKEDVRLTEKQVSPGIRKEKILPASENSG